MVRSGTTKRWAAIYLLFAALALANSGCLVVAAGAAAGGAVGYAYYQGNVTRYYAANLEDVRSATRSALAELGMPITGEKNESGGYQIDTKTADGDRVRINLELQTSRIPAEGALTKVGVRVATFGDGPVSERVLEQIGYHLVPAAAPVARTPTVLGAPQPSPPGPIQQTAAPPLLPTEPIKVK